MEQFDDNIAFDIKRNQLSALWNQFRLLNNETFNKNYRTTNQIEIVSISTVNFTRK